MKLFPDHWANPNAEFAVVATPIGAQCAGCPGKILQGDRGLLMPHIGGPDEPHELPWHQDCFRRAIGL